MVTVMTGLVCFLLTARHVMLQLLKQIRGIFRSMTNVSTASVLNLPHSYTVIQETLPMNPLGAVSIPGKMNRPGAIFSVWETPV